jgi:hypothetical protein
MNILQSILSAFVVSLLVAPIEGWSCLPPSPVKKIQEISRKSFLVGAAGGFVLGTTATAAGAAVAIDRSTAANKGPYEPAAGSLADKVVLITGGTSGLGLVSQRW